MHLVVTLPPGYADQAAAARAARDGCGYGRFRPPISDRMHARASYSGSEAPGRRTCPIRYGACARPFAKVVIAHEHKMVIEG